MEGALPRRKRAILSANLNTLIPELRPFARELLRAAGLAGYLPRVTSTLRSSAEQARLYRRSLAGLNAYPVAPPGSSAHEYGFAFDMVVSPMEGLADVGQYWEQLGGVWGGRFGDEVHFEYPGFKQYLVSIGGSQTPDASFLGQTVENTLSILANPYVSLFTPTVLGVRETPSYVDEAARRIRDYFKSF